MIERPELIQIFPAGNLGVQAEDEARPPIDLLNPDSYFQRTKLFEISA
jgi:hypothetical protein